MLLTELAQAFYVERFGSPDESPIDAAHFRRPEGYFVVAYEHGVPAAMGGWRRHDDAEAEVKRMYVREGYRRRGLAKSVLRHIEDSARAHGFERLVLETGHVLPEAVALYRAAGYEDVPPFGYYSDPAGSAHLGKVLDPGERTPEE